MSAANEPRLRGVRSTVVFGVLGRKAKTPPFGRALRHRAGLQSPVRSGLTRRTLARCMSRAGTDELYAIKGMKSSEAGRGREAYILEF